MGEPAEDEVARRSTVTVMNLPCDSHAFSRVRALLADGDR